MPTTVSSSPRGTTTGCAPPPSSQALRRRWPDSVAASLPFLPEERNLRLDAVGGELVPVEIRRADGALEQLWISRGPLGVRLDLASVDPDS